MSGQNTSKTIFCLTTKLHSKWPQKMCEWCSWNSAAVFSLNHQWLRITLETTVRIRANWQKDLKHNTLYQQCSTSNSSCQLFSQLSSTSLSCGTARKETTLIDLPNGVLLGNDREGVLFCKDKGPQKRAENEHNLRVTWNVTGQLCPRIENQELYNQVSIQKTNKQTNQNRPNLPCLCLSGV